MNLEQLQERISPLLDTRDGISDLHPLHLNQMVADHAEKFLVIDRLGRNSAVVSVSSAAFPNKEHDAALRARAAADSLGQHLGSAVLSPWFVGELDMVSFAITPYAPPLSSQKVSRWLQQRQLRAPLLRWLLDSTAKTSRLPSLAEISSEFLVPLAALRENLNVAPGLRSVADAALHAIAGKRWRPRLVLAHNDLWLGNVHWAPERSPSAHKFVVIDWLGSRTVGHAIYDLVRLSLSFGLSQQATVCQIAAHADALGCRLEETGYHLAASLGHLSLNLGEWPEARFVETANQCHARLAECMHGKSVTSAVAETGPFRAERD